MTSIVVVRMSVKRMFKLSTIYIDTASQSLAPLSDHIVSHMLAVVPIPPQSADAVHRHLWSSSYLQRIYNISRDNSHSGLKSFNRWIFVPIFSVNIWPRYNKQAKGMFFYETQCITSFKSRKNELHKVTSPTTCQDVVDLFCGLVVQLTVQQIHNKSK